MNELFHPWFIFCRYYYLKKEISRQCSLEKEKRAHPLYVTSTWGEVIKLISFVLLLSQFFDIVKTHVSYQELHSCLTEYETAGATPARDMVEVEKI